VREATAAPSRGGIPEPDPLLPTRVSAARALAALRPEEVKPETEHQSQPAPSIVVYDLPPGSNPVLHRAPNREAAAPVSDAEAPSEQLPTTSPHVFVYQPPDEESEIIGEWSPAGLDQSPDATVTIRSTEDRETAQLWRAELAAGRLPQTKP
jgi:hypothetical protein